MNIQSDCLQENLKRVLKESFSMLEPSKVEPLSEWANKHFVLSSESSSVTGKWHCYPYQKGILDALSDPLTQKVSVIKSARVGYTKILNIFIANHIATDPCPMLMILPTIDDAKRYSKIELDPMLRDMSVLYGKVAEPKSRSGKNTQRHKEFPGGVLYLVGANSPTGLRAFSARYAIRDEIDGFPLEAGDEGDPISLSDRRTETFWNRKSIDGSTPTIQGLSRIERLFDAGDQRRFFVPCPFCNFMHVLQFSNMKWETDNPNNVWFVCPECKKEIHPEWKYKMIESGEWQADKPFAGHASFHIWAAYSYSSGATWEDIAKEFIRSHKNPVLFKTFINTWLGETWKEPGDVPDKERLYERRENYPVNIIPSRARYVTAAADIQRDRIEVEIKAWGAGLENWSLDYRVFDGNTDDLNSNSWKQLERLLVEEFPREDTGELVRIDRLGIDSGFNTQKVYSWIRIHSQGGRILALKGVEKAKSIIQASQSLDIKPSGKNYKRGIKLWTVHTSQIKQEIYSWLRLSAPTKENPEIPIGFPHFTVQRHDEEYFRMLTAEQMLKKKRKNGYSHFIWTKVYDRNEALDLFVYNVALAYLLGVNRLKREEIKVVNEKKPNDSSSSTIRKKQTNSSGVDFSGVKNILRNRPFR